MNTRSNNTPFWLLLIGLFLILVSKSLLTEGMFFDGVTYASISRNMAEGQGTFGIRIIHKRCIPSFVNILL